MVESLQKVYKNIKENLSAYPPESPRRGGLRRHLHPAVSTAAGTVDLVMRAIPKRADIPITTVPFAGSAEAALYQPIDYLGTKEWAAFLRREYKDYGDFDQGVGHQDLTPATDKYHERGAPVHASCGCLPETNHTVILTDIRLFER